MSPRPDNSDAPFFVGWAPAPKELRAFLISFVLSAIAFAAVASYLVAATQNDPGSGAFRGRAQAEGVLTLNPYPVVHVTASERFAPGDALLLSGGGKIGVQERVAEFDGALVTVQGNRLERGALTGLQLAGGNRGINAAEGTAAVPETRSLGRWRLTGEICDGKCLIGAMRPGRGLAHKACANLCIAGGVPPVFVATDTVEGSEFFLLANEDGGPIDETLFDYTAILIEAEGTVERIGTLNIFRIERDTIQVAR